MSAAKPLAAGRLALGWAAALGARAGRPPDVTGDELANAKLLVSEL